MNNKYVVLKDAKGKSMWVGCKLMLPDMMTGKDTNCIFELKQNQEEKVNKDAGLYFYCYEDGCDYDLQFLGNRELKIID